MKIEALLERKEQLQILILRNLVLQGGTASINGLREHVQLSKASFDQYLEDIELIGRMMEKKVEVQRNEYQALLVLDEDVSLEKILLFLLQESLKFKMLVYLLEHQQVSIVRLATAFNISESSVFRKIKELNQLLEEFGLQIKNGQLYGEELQIRYFYYELFQYIPEDQRPLFLQNTPEKRPFILGLDRVLETTFTASAEAQIACWLGITKKRLLNEKSTYATLKEKKLLYQSDRLYQAIDPIIVMHLSRTAAELNVYETMMFYSFFVSFSIVDPRRLKIKEEKAVGYQISQINNEWFFFVGKIEVYERDRLLEQQQKMLGHSLTQLLAKLQETAVQQLPRKRAEDSELSYLMIQYANVLLMIDFYIAKPVVIGIDLESLPIYRIAFQQYLIRELRGIGGIEIGSYEEGKEYDLVITFCQRNKKQCEYYLSEFASPYDIIRLKRRIETLKKEKN
ncbi:MAG: helix-turn-helix domain-containing protein [Enterococcus faecium]|nr:helix-turn-helix domain-containing protein [Enterococcus faecium]